MVNEVELRLLSELGTLNGHAQRFCLQDVYYRDRKADVGDPQRDGDRVRGHDS
jgi:hypothetical protein